MCNSNDNLEEIYFKISKICNHKFVRKNIEINRKY